MVPKISVVMSVYNGEKYLKEAVESILNQSFDDFEFIIINDASTDSSLQILESYKDSRINIINNGKNIGLTKSLNKGVGLAKGKYIARMDSDDISEESRFEIEYSKLEQNPQITVVGSNVQHIDSEGNELEVVKYPETQEEHIGNIFFANTLVHSTTMFRKLNFDNVGGYNEEFYKAQDYDLWFKLLNDGGVLFNIQKSLLKYRLHNESISIKYSKEQDKNAQKILADAFNTILKINVKSREIDYLRHVKVLNPIQSYLIYNFFIKSNIAFRKKFSDYPFAQDIFAHNSLNLIKEERYKILFRKNIIEKYAKSFKNN